MEKYKVAVVIPAYNEAKTIKRLVKSVIKVADPIVVNDGSQDDTTEILKKLKIKYLLNQTNKGYEKTIIKGLKYAKKKKYKFILTFDADGQHKLSDLRKIIKILNSDKFYCVYGVRKRLQRFSEYIFSYISKVLYGLEDPLSGLKGYNSKFLKFSRELENSICTELLFNIRRKNLSIKQIKIKTNLRKNDSRFGGFFLANFKIMKSLGRIISNYKLK